MNYGNLFLDIDVPKPLNKKELNDLFYKYRSGDMKARETIINTNIRLVLSRVLERYSDTVFEKEELISIGLVGLVKSVDSFDIFKNNCFSTYAIRCIDNEILMYFRKYNRTLNNISLNEFIALENQDRDNIEFEDIIEDESADFVTKYENEETKLIVRSIVNVLPEREKYIIGLYFGFFDDEPINQREIAAKLNLSQSQICKTINNILKKICRQLKEEQIIDETVIIPKKKRTKR